MTILNAIHLAGTITVPDRRDPLTLAIDLDVDGLASWTVALAGDDHGRIVASADPEAAWLVAQLAEAVASLTPHLRRSDAA